MIPLPPGCTVLYSIWIDIDELSNDIIDWYEQIGGSKKTDTYYDHRGREKTDTYVSYGKGKWCHHHHNGEGGTRLHFLGKDASIASMFMIKFMDKVTKTNFKEHLERLENESY